MYSSFIKTFSLSIFISWVNLFHPATSITSNSFLLKVSEIYLIFLSETSKSWRPTRWIVVRTSWRRRIWTFPEEPSSSCRRTTSSTTTFRWWRSVFFSSLRYLIPMSVKKSKFCASSLSSILWRFTKLLKAVDLSQVTIIVDNVLYKKKSKILIFKKFSKIWNICRKYHNLQKKLSWIQVSYEFTDWHMLYEPLYAVGFFLAFFLFVIFYVRLDFSMKNTNQ